MKSYIFYNTITGIITTQRNLTEAGLTTYLVTNTHLSALEGKVQNVNNQKIDITTTPHSIIDKPADTVNIAEYIRQKRNSILKWCDWTIGADSPLSDSKKTEWQTYRQALRNLPDTNTATEVDNIVWPSQPE